MKKQRYLVHLSLCFMLTSCFEAPTYEGPTSDHFDGKVFYNRSGVSKSFWDVITLGIRALWQREPWPAPAPLGYKPTPPVERVFNGLKLTYINHSTYLIQIEGVNILTDPIFSERASPVTWFGPRRALPPAFEPESLPTIDVVIISHNHYDHLDLASLTRIIQNNISKGGYPPTLLAGLGNGELFRKQGFKNFYDLDWQDSKVINDIHFTFTECQHRSGRGLRDQMKTLWGAFAIVSPHYRLYFAGDTGYSPHFVEAGKAFGPFDVALLPIGAYEPRAFMKAMHINPEEAVQAHKDLRSKKSLAMHHSTFQLTFEGMNKPKEDLERSLKSAQVPADQFQVLKFGEAVHFNL